MAETVKLKIHLMGGENGSYSYSDSPDGAFTSTGILSLGSNPIVGGTLTGHIKNHLITDYQGDNLQSGVKATYLFDGKSLKVELSTKKTVTVPYNDTTGHLLGILHPQLSIFTLQEAEKIIKATPGTTSTKMTVFLVESAVALPVTITSREPKLVKVGTEQRPVKRFKVLLNGIEIEYGLDENKVVALEIATQKIRLLADGYEGFFEDPLAKYPELSQPNHKTKVESGTRITMRDGVHLVAEIWRPNDSSKHPTILERTPYGREATALEGPFWASRGYVFVAQDCRGRNDSEGEWDPFIHETTDGVDTINWIAAQPWSDAKVGMIGGSYLGFVQWAAAVAKPAALKCIVPQVSPPGDAMHNLPYDFGIPMVYADLWWAKIVAGKKADMSGVKNALPKPQSLTTLPISELDQAVLGQKLDFYRKWMKRETLADWKGWDFAGKIGSVTIPVLHISGTWDGDEMGTQMNWNSLQVAGHKRQWIVFGPWIHAFNTTHSFGGEEYGNGAILELDSLYLRWFDTWLKGKSVGMEKVPHVKLFVTGANKWIEAPAWPSTKMPEVSMYLSKDKLVQHPSANESFAYIYDPQKDTAIPSALIQMDESKQTVKLDLADFKGRPHLFMTSSPFTKATAVTGPVTTTLYFSSNAVDTDFIAALADVAPDGTIRAVGQSGKIRTSYLGGFDKRRPLKPGKVYRAQIEHWNFAHEFAAGHRIGLLVSSSGFPVYARNLGTVESVASATKMVSQKNTFYFGKDHPSHLSYRVLW